MSNNTPALTITDELLTELAGKPYAMDLFTLMRRLEASNNTRPKWGFANKYRDEILQFGQEPSSIFANSTIAKLYQYKNNRKPKVAINGFGLFGPNGVMPLVFTEYVKERMTHNDDHALGDFVDIFHNRLIMLFYRAWADANSCATLDYRDEKFTDYIISLCAASFSKKQTADSIPSHSRWHNAGHLLRQARTAEGLKNILTGFFNVPVKIEEFVSRWLQLPDDEKTCLGNPKGTQLGIDTLLGSKVMSTQHHFQIQMGPLDQQQYEQFLPNTHKYRQLRDWVRTYVGMEFSWDIKLILDKKSCSTTGLALGHKKCLGRNSWLGNVSDVENCSTYGQTFAPELTHEYN